MTSTTRTSPAEARRPLALAIDIGTSSTRALVYDARGRAVDGWHAQRRYDIETGKDGRSTFDADELRRLTEDVLDELCSEIGDVDIPVVGVSCFWHSLVGLDDGGHPVTPIYYWGDNRSVDQVDQLRANMDQAAWRAQTGCLFHSNFWPAKLLWLSQTDPERFATVRQWTAPTGVMSRQWLGSDALSLGMASGTGMVDLSTGAWISSVGEILAIQPSTLPPIVDRDEPTALVTSYRKRWAPLADARWYPALGDGACATIGSGSVDLSRIAMTLGSSGATRAPVPAPLGSYPPLETDLWIYRIDRSTALYGAAISNGGLMLDWTLDLLGDVDGTLRQQAADLEPAAHGLTILPFLSAERAPIWNDRARGVISGLTLATSRADVVRAATEAVAFRLAETCDAVRAIAPADAQIIANGAALLKSDLLLQIVTDTLAVPVVALDPDLESAARGAALLALSSFDPSVQPYDPVAGARTVRPDSGRTERYRQERIRQNALIDLFQRPDSPWTSPPGEA